MSASSLDNWSFENLTRSTDSGYPLLNSTAATAVPIDTKLQQQSLAVVLNLHKSPSSESNNIRHPKFAVSSSESLASTLQQQQQQQQRRSAALYYNMSNSNNRVLTPPSPPTQSIVALSSSSRPSSYPYHSASSSSGSHNNNDVDIQAALALPSTTGNNTNNRKKKTYDLPANTDRAAPLNQLEYSQQWLRIRIERDYLEGDTRQFSLNFPPQLEGKLEERKFKRFVRRINAMLAEGEGATVRNVMEGVLAFTTLYLSTLLITPHFKKTLDRISQYVTQENEVLFRPAGLLVLDPKQTAYMFIEIAPLRK